MSARTEDGPARRGAELVVVVEIAGGTRNKYEMDPESGVLFLERTLFTATRYPADYGFIEGTCGEDGDPLDALVLVTEPTFPGCRIPARAIGMFEMQDEKGRDTKVLCVPERDPTWSRTVDIEDVRTELRAEIQHFFAVYKDLEGIEVETGGFADREAALQVVEHARERLARSR